MFLPLEIIRRCERLLALHDETRYRSELHSLVSDMWRLHYGYVNKWQQYLDNINIMGLSDLIYDDIAGDRFWGADLKVALRALVETESDGEPERIALSRAIQAYLSVAVNNPLVHWL